MASSRKADHARRLNGFALPETNEIWAAEILGMQRNLGKGIDLIDDSRNLGVEIKFMLRPGESTAWTVQDHQVSYADNGRECYWGFGFYQLSRPVLKIRARKVETIERLVTRRELYLVSWDWINQFPPSRTKGKTDKSEWDLTLRYAGIHSLPRAFRIYDVEKGQVHLTTRVPRKMFEDHGELGLD